MYFLLIGVFFLLNSECGAY